MVQGRRYNASWPSSRHQRSSHPRWVRTRYNAPSRPLPRRSHGHIIIQCVCLYPGCTDTCTCYNISSWLFFTAHIIIHQRSSHPHWLHTHYNAPSRPLPRRSHGHIIVQCVCLYSSCTDTCMRYNISSWLFFTAHIIISPAFIPSTLATYTL